tara:strand:+ start:512 stop:802 length:291 start_codon:yes stop_codon:yes gene_type:complete
MSPLNKKKLTIIRNKLDKLDNSLIKIIKKRTNLVKKVLKLKETKKQIVDKKRINIILKNIRKKSIKNNIDPAITKKIWLNMIRAYINFEKKNFKKK